MNRELWKWCAIAGLAAALLAPPLAAQEERSLSLRVIYGPEGKVEVWRDGKRIAVEQQETKDGKLLIRNAEGEQLLELDLEAKGPLVFPGWRDAARNQPFRMEFFAPQASKPRNKIGVNVTPVSPALGAQLELEPSAALVIAEVEKDMPAAHAGLQRYDVIVAIDERRPVTSEKLREAVAAAETGATILLEIRRAAKPMKVEVEVVTVAEEGAPNWWTGQWLKEAGDQRNRWQIPEGFFEQIEIDAPSLDGARIHLPPNAMLRDWMRALPPPAEPPAEATEEIEIEQPAVAEGWRMRLRELEARLEKLEEMSRKQIELIETWLKRTEKGER